MKEGWECIGEVELGFGDKEIGKTYAGGELSRR